MPYRFRVLGLLFALVFVMYLDRLCIAVAGPRIQREMGISPSHWGWVIGAFTLAYALFEVPSGMLGDRIGARKVLTRIVLWWSAFTALTGAVTELSGCCWWCAFFSAREKPDRSPTARRRSRAGCPLPNGHARSACSGWPRPREARCPLRSSCPSNSSYGWRAAFFVFGFARCFLERDLVLVVPRYARRKDRRFRRRRGRRSERLPSRSGHRVQWSQLLRNGNFQRLLLMYHTYCWGAYFYLSWLHTYLQVGRGLTENQMKIAASLPSCAGFAGIVAGGYFSDRLARTHSLRFARCAIGSTGLIVSGVLLLCATVDAE